MKKELFDDLVSSMSEMVAIEKGKMAPKSEHVHRHAIPDVKLLRKSSGMKQAEFAKAVGASVGLVQSWEQERRIPSGSALKLLLLIERNPALLDELLVI